VKRQFEEGVKRLSTGIDGSYSCRSQDNVFLLRSFSDVAQESRFTRTSLAGKEKRPSRILYDLQRLLPLAVVRVKGMNFEFCHFRNLLQIYEIILR
jgi:hypothetical protein